MPKTHPQGWPCQVAPCSGSVGHSVLYSPSPQPISWLCTAMLLLKARRCARTRGNPCINRERTVHTNHSIRYGSFADWLKGGCLSSLILPHREQITAHLLRCSTRTGNRKTFSRFTTAAHLPQSFPFHCETVNENAIKDERGKLCTVKSKDTDSFFLSFNLKIRKLEVSCKLNECLI